jgi:RND family efflux transporter MFP subunit
VDELSDKQPDVEQQTLELSDVIVPGVLSNSERDRRRTVADSQPGWLGSSRQVISMWTSRPLFVAMLCSGALLAGCNRPPPQTPPTTVPKVVVTLPVCREITDHEEFNGRAEALRTVEIRARVTGYLDKVLFKKEGEEVKLDEPLFAIDPRTYEAELARAEATLRQNQALLKRLELDYKRAEPLLPDRAISREDFDKIVGDREGAAAAVAEAARDTAQLNVNWTTVTAPMAGRISRQMVDPGNLVKADDTILTTLVSLDPIYAYFDVDERTNLKVKRLIESGKMQSARKTAVEIRLGLSDEDQEGASDEERFPHLGTINFIDNRQDPATGTLRLRGVFPNPQKLISPGMFVRIRVPIGAPHEAILVPDRALAQDQGRKYVFVVDATNKPARRYVTIGTLIRSEKSQDSLRVIAEGLAKDERVVVDGLQKIRLGEKVTTEELQSGKVAAEKTPVSGGRPSS